MTKKIDWLIIAEKESQGKDIARALFDKGRPKGQMTRGGLGGRGLSSYLDGTVVVDRAQGHLFELEYPNVQDKKYDRKGEPEVDDWGITISSGWKSDEEMLDVYPVELNIYRPLKFKPNSSRSRTIANNLKRLVQNADKIIVATDGDPEGEMIYRNFEKVMLNQKVPRERLYRVLLSSLDPVSVREAFENSLQRYDQFSGSLGEFYGSLEPRGFARSISDYEFGLTYVLLGSLVSGSVGVDGKLSTRAWGRLKNTILGHVREREVSHDTFKPSSQYRLDLKTTNGAVLQGKLYDTRKDAQEALEALGLPSQVNIQTQSKTVTQTPPSLFSRAELLVAMSRSPYQSNDWGRVLQSTYERHKVMSYPRTDSQHVTDKEWSGLKKYLLNNPFVKGLLEERIEQVTAQNKGVDGLDWSWNLDRTPTKKWLDESKTVPHYALIPNFELLVDERIYKRLSQAEKGLYLTALYHTLSLFVSDTIIDETQARVEASGVTFSGRYKAVKEQGWRLLQGRLEQSEIAPQSGMQSVEYIITEVPARRPALLSEASLLSLLKNRQEGTSATRDSTIAQMLRSKVLVKDKGRLRVNKQLAPAIDLMLKEGWIDMDQTADWQKGLDTLTTPQEAVDFIEGVRRDTQALQNKIRQGLDV